LGREGTGTARVCVENLKISCERWTQVAEGLEPETFNLSVVWVGLEELPALTANVFIVQNDGELVHLSIGQVSPPILIGTPEEQREQLAQVPFVPARPIARVAITPSKARELYELLGGIIQNTETAKGGGGRTP